MKKSNHLINETSPYLLQHAYNPVDWYPWKESTFKKAIEEDKVIFLSIGYSTCHWCHVMAHESFEDEEVAKILNKDFIAIKVDREERPDIDSIYMDVAQALTGSGGWPLSIFMTPSKKPFYAGTYFPKKSKYGRAGLIDILNAIGEQWREDKEKLISSGEEITSFVKSNSQIENFGKNNLSKKIILDGLNGLKDRFDRIYGGFGSEPKFPTPQNILFLLHAYGIGIDDKALQIAEKTLDSMYKGGIFDHIGYGFSRYSVDEKWLAPHFEKMLYDNALLTIAYTEGYEITKKKEYRYIVEKTLEYITREMTSKEGVFYSAQDADSEGEEGKYYTWTYDEIIEILGEDGKEFCEKYDISKKGNFEGKNILNLIDSKLEIPNEKTRKHLENLYNIRKNRYDLHIDDKVLVSWNAMMIAAFAKAGRVFNNDGYIEIAKKAYDFINDNMVKEDGSLYISYREGKMRGNGLLDDYAYLAWASLELYKSTFSPEYLENAKDIYFKIEERFYDINGGYFLSPENNSDLIYRPKEFYDGAVPSGNSVVAYVLSLLSKYTGSLQIEKMSEKQVKVIASLAGEQPQNYVFGLKSLLLNLYPTKELVSVLKDESVEKFGKELSKCYRPQMTTVVITKKTRKKINSISEFTKEYSLEDEELFYLCQNNTCLTPVKELEEILKNI